VQNPVSDHDGAAIGREQGQQIELLRRQHDITPI